MKRSLFVVMAGLTTDELEVINSGVGGLKYLPRKTCITL